jgi:hypothetical protein
MFTRTVDEATAIYENAAAKNPKNEDLQLSVFYSYIRKSDYQKQKDVCRSCLAHTWQTNSCKLLQISMRMYKQFQKDKYLLWGVMSLTQQVGVCRKH